MAGPTDQEQPQTITTPVPDLIERYRVRRDAWIAQADELARLRDEVRSSAEREAMEIVTAARRDVRKVIMEARRELLVLSAQVQAALGEANPKTDPAILLSKAGIMVDSGIHASLTGATDVFAPEDAVNEILNEVHDDMTALAEDAKALPLQSIPTPRQISPSPSPTSSSPAAAPHPLRSSPSAPSSSRPPASSLQTPAPHPDLAAVMSRIPEPVTLPLEVPDLGELASEDLYSSYSSPFPPSDAVPVTGAKRLNAFVGVFVGIGLVVAGLTVWWLTHRSASVNEPESSVASAPQSQPASRPPNPASTSPSPGAKASTPSASSANLALVGEALREVWIRTTIDGKSDSGRTLTAGQIIDVSAEKSISLVVGDAGAIVVSVNKGAKLPLGRDGEVVTRVFDVAKTNVAGATPSKAPVAPTPERTASARPAPPIASAAPAVAVPGPAPTPAPTAATGGLSSFLPTAPSQAPAPPVNTVPPVTAQPSTTAASKQLASAPAPPANAAQDGSSATVVVAYARQWLDAYHRQDRATMAALSTENMLLADERGAEERFPPGLADVTRTLDRVSVQIAADTAVLTAVMMEQSGSIPSPHVSPISQVWVLGGGQWKVRQARFVSAARLNQVFK